MTGLMSGDVARDPRANLEPTDHLTYKEKPDPNVTSAFEVITSTDKCLSYLRRAQ